MGRSRKIRAILLLSLIFGSIAMGCLGGKEETRARIQILGAGSSFINPLMQLWIYNYTKSHPSVRINYQSVGSGAGIRQFIEGTVDFGASDAPMNREEFDKARRNPRGVLHVPITLGAIAIVYSLPELEGRKLVLSGEVLADIYLGKIKKWNDPAIARLNPGIDLPDKPIIVVKRADSSGTTYIFTDYLSSVSEEWRNRIGKTKVFSFPESILQEGRGLQGKGNEGVTALIKQIPYAIGYVELSYALETGLEYARIVNREGRAVEPTLESITEAARNSAPLLPEPDSFWGNVSLVNAPGDKSYPIVSFVYLLLYKEYPREKGERLLEFLRWANSDGQSLAPRLHYAPLPENVRRINEKAFSMIRLVG